MFSYDEANRLARAVGVDLDKDVIGRLAEKRAAISSYGTAHTARPRGHSARWMGPEV